MKKTLTVLTLSLVILLTSCSKEDPVFSNDIKQGGFFNGKYRYFKDESREFELKFIEQSYNPYFTIVADNDTSGVVETITNLVRVSNTAIYGKHNLGEASVFVSELGDRTIVINAVDGITYVATEVK